MLFGKNNFVFAEKTCHYEELNQYSLALKIRFRLFTDFKTVLKKTPISGEIFCRVSRVVSLFQKMVLYPLTKFGIIKPWTNIPWLTRFDWGFWQSSKQFCRKFQYRENAFGNIRVCLVFPEKLFCIRWLNLALLSLESIFHGPQDSI